MRFAAIALVVVIGAQPAHADGILEASIAAGTSGQGAIANGARSQLALVDGRLAVHWVRAPRPLDVRGLHMCSLDDAGCAWFFTSLDRDDEDGVGAELTSRMHYVAAGDATSNLELDGRARAEVVGWRIEGRAAFQPETTLRDRFFRSNRGVMQTSLAFGIPPMWALGTRAIQLAVFPMTIDLGTRRQRDPDGVEDIGFDREIGLVGARVQSAMLTVDLVTMRYAELGAADHRVGATTYGTSVTTIDIDVLAVEARLPHAVALAGRVGVADRAPVASFEQTGNSSHSYGPSVFAPSYWLEARHHSFTEQEPFAFTVGGGSWLRLDPSGHAADRGHLGSLAAQVRRGRFTLRTDVEAGRLRRAVVGNLASTTMPLAPVGTRMTMGRGRLHATYAMTPSLSLESGAWVEHSDRSDPRWAATIAPSSEPATHAGADVVARWSFDAKRR